jgi:hypothetical protein
VFLADRVSAEWRARGTGVSGCGTGAACGDPVDESYGTHAYPYRLYVWAYNANDLVAVRAGTRQPWDVVPYAVWDLGVEAISEFSGAAAYDPATSRIYVSQVNGNGERPVIHVFSVGPQPVAPAIMVQPINSTARTNSGTAAFGAAASGQPALTVQWQLSTDFGGSRNPMTRATSTTHAFTAVPADSGKRFRAVVTNTVGTATTGAAGLTVTASPDPNTMRLDFSGDARPDLFWRNYDSGANALWYLNGVSLSASVGLMTVTSPAWKVAAVEDFDGDGRPDLFWRNAATNQHVIWCMNGAAIASTGSFPTTAGTLWQIVGAAAFNGDANPDLLWRHVGSGSVVAWYLTGAAVAGDNVVWLMNGVTLLPTGVPTTVADANWEIAAARDLTLDGHPDLVWRNGATGDNTVWCMNLTTMTGSYALPAAPVAYGLTR